MVETDSLYNNVSYSVWFVEEGEDSEGEEVKRMTAPDPIPIPDTGAEISLQHAEDPQGDEETEFHPIGKQDYKVKKVSNTYLDIDREKEDGESEKSLATATIVFLEPMEEDFAENVGENLGGEDE